MLKSETKQLLENLARRICRENKLNHVYFAQSLGKRKHYLAGYGQENFAPAEHMILSENLVVFWQGDLSEEAKKSVKRNCDSIVEKVERELETLQNGSS